MVYHKILNAVPCAVGPCRTLLFIHFTYESAHLLTPNSLPPSLPHLSSPWQPQFCHLCLWACFSFIYKFIRGWRFLCIIEYIHFLMLVQKSLKTHRTELFTLLLENSLQFDTDSFSFIPFYLSFPFCCTDIQLRCLFLDHSHVMGDCCVSRSSYLFLQPTVMECRLVLALC